MKYGEHYVSICYDKGIERQNPITGEDEICEGVFCQIYRDEDMTDEVDNFCLAVGHEIEEYSDVAIDKGIRWYLGINEPEEDQVISFEQSL